MFANWMEFIKNVREEADEEERRQGMLPTIRERERESSVDGWREDGRTLVGSSTTQQRVVAMRAATT